jgi:hypothetical protein
MEPNSMSRGLRSFDADVSRDAALSGHSPDYDPKVNHVAQHFTLHRLRGTIVMLCQLLEWRLLSAFRK